MRKTAACAVLLTVFLLGWGSARAEEPPDMNPAEGATVHAIATTLEALEDWIAAQESCPLEPGLQTMEEVRELLPAELRNRIVVQDGWTRPFFGWCREGHWALISFGADGEPDVDYNLLPALGDAVDDFVVLDGRLGTAPGNILILQQLGQQKRSMMDLRSIAIVFEAFHLDNEVFPGGSVTKMEPVGRLLSDVQPVYIRRLPLTDGWGNAFLYWTDGEAYRVASAGSDGVFEADYTNSPGTGAFDASDFDRDIVFANGEFEQWPSQPQDAAD